jgi:hypothetical protein
MKWAALVTWVVTAGGGFAMLGLWVRNGGMAQAGRRGRLIRPPLILSHFALAATGLVLWIIYLASDSDALAWVALALLAIVALLGFTMFAIWLQQRRAAVTSPASGPAATAPAVESSANVASAPTAERSFPVPIVALHGVLAASTLVLVLLTAAGVGD